MAFWAHRTVPITVPAGGTTNYTLTIPGTAGFIRPPCTTATVEGSTTVAVALAQPSMNTIPFTVRNLSTAHAQTVRVNVHATDTY